MSWLATGAASQHLAEQEEREFQERKKGYVLPFRFFMDRGEEAEITFIDGDLDQDGHLTPPRFFEHTINVGGKIQNYICPQKTNPEVPGECPICASGDRPALVAVFTIIDHRERPSQDGQTVYRDRVKLLVAKPTAFDALALQARKNGGLGCARYKVSRIGDKASAIGDTFEFLGKEDRQKLRNRYFRVAKATEEEIAQGKKPEYRVTNFVPVDYEQDFPYYTCEQLANMGIGRAVAGTNQGMQGNGSKSFNNGPTYNNNYVPPSQATAADDVNYDTEL